MIAFIIFFCKTKCSSMKSLKKLHTKFHGPPWTILHVVTPNDSFIFKMWSKLELEHIFVYKISFIQPSLLRSFEHIFSHVTRTTCKIVPWRHLVRSLYVPPHHCVWFYHSHQTIWYALIFSCVFLNKMFYVLQVFCGTVSSYMRIV